MKQDECRTLIDDIYEAKKIQDLIRLAINEGHEFHDIGVFADGSLYIRSYNENANYIGEVPWTPKPVNK